MNSIRNSTSNKKYLDADILLDFFYMVGIPILSDIYSFLLTAAYQNKNTFLKCIEKYVVKNVNFQECFLTSNSLIRYEHSLPKEIQINITLMVYGRVTNSIFIDQDMDLVQCFRKLKSNTVKDATQIYGYYYYGFPNNSVVTNFMNQKRRKGKRITKG